jgi:hypothetical protein
MSRRKPAVNFRAKADTLRKFGFPVKYGKRGHFKAKDKAAVTRAWNKIKFYVEPGKQEFVWQKSSGKELASVRKGLSSRQITPNGFFLKKSKFSKSRPKLKLLRPGVLSYTARGKRGYITEEIHEIDPELLAEDPPKTIMAMGKKGDKVILTVNGFDSAVTTEYTLKTLAYYMALDLLPKFLDPNLDEAYTRRHGRGHRSLDDFVNIFHVKIIRHHRGKPRKKNSRR